MIIPVWQKLYQSTHQLAAKIGLQLGEVATHTGTLDPMAEGVVIVLTGEDRYLKGKLDWQKTYEFSILWGIQTDSGDQLGLITQALSAKPTYSEIEQVIKNFPTVYCQDIPNFSARRWQGESAFDAAKRNIKLPAKVRQVSINSLKTTKPESLTVQQCLNQQSKAVAKVAGEFRQSEIIENWLTTLSTFPLDSELCLSHHQVTTSSGTYIRQLVQDIAALIKQPALTWSIVRMKNGPYTKDDTRKIT